MTSVRLQRICRGSAFNASVGGSGRGMVGCDSVPKSLHQNCIKTNMMMHRSIRRTVKRRNDRGAPQILLHPLVDLCGHIHNIVWAHPES